MANREQHRSKEKKKPKASKQEKNKPAPPPAFVEPALVRKPHKDKAQG